MFPRCLFGLFPAQTRHQSEGVVARADYGIPVCEWWVGGPPKLFLSSSFFLSFFFLLSGQVMVLVSSGFVHGMSPRGGPALGSGGLGGGLGGLGGGLGGLSGFFGGEHTQHTSRALVRTEAQTQGWWWQQDWGGRDLSETKQLGYEVRAEWAVLTCVVGSLCPPSWWGGC